MNLLTIFSCVLLYNVLFCCIHVILTRLLLDMFFRVGHSTCQALLTAAAVSTGIARGSWGPTSPVTERESFSCNIANTKLATEYVGSSVTFTLSYCAISMNWDPQIKTSGYACYCNITKITLFCGDVECYFLQTFLNTRFC